MKMEHAVDPGRITLSGTNLGDSLLRWHGYAETSADHHFTLAAGKD